ncbi:MAG: thiamine diphosphokinase [Bacteroidales bacterium]|nr:thiamine diphosphokinase [Bacteroidales bacterium]
MNDLGKSVVVLADGQFPSHPLPLKTLAESSVVVSCDGAAEKLLAFGREPDWVVGDMDSLSPGLQSRWEKIVIHSQDQESNDLTKALLFCREKGFENITILGATGLREDHTLGNIALIAEHVHRFHSLTLETDYGRFIPLVSSTTLPSCLNQQISLFTLDPFLKITTEGLRYPIQNRALSSWWEGTLNASEGESFRISFERGIVLVYMAY